MRMFPNSPETDRGSSSTGSRFPLLAVGLVALVLLHIQGTSVLLQATGPLRPQPNISLSQAEKLDYLEGERILSDFRRQRLGGDYSFKFELKHMPRRGPATRHRGQLWGTWGDSGARTRIFIPGGVLGEENKRDLTMLVHNGPQPKVWSLSGKVAGIPQTARELSGEEMFEPLLPGLVITPFDLQMPFIFWTEYVFEGKFKKLGHTVFAFLMYPPETTAAVNPNLGAVRIFLEEKSRQWLKAELVDTEGQPLKTFKIISIKRIRDEGFPKTIDFFDERTRSKTRFRITAAALGQNFPEEHFQPERLAEEVPFIPEEAFTHFK